MSTACFIVTPKSYALPLCNRCIQLKSAGYYWRWKDLVGYSGYLCILWHFCLEWALNKAAFQQLVWIPPCRTKMVCSRFRECHCCCGSRSTEPSWFVGQDQRSKYADKVVHELLFLSSEIAYPAFLAGFRNRERSETSKGLLMYKRWSKGRLDNRPCKYFYSIQRPHSGKPIHRDAFEPKLAFWGHLRLLRNQLYFRWVVLKRTTEQSIVWLGVEFFGGCKSSQLHVLLRWSIEMGTWYAFSAGFTNLNRQRGLNGKLCYIYRFTTTTWTLFSLCCLRTCYRFY